MEDCALMDATARDEFRAYYWPHQVYVTQAASSILEQVLNDSGRWDPMHLLHEHQGPVKIVESNNLIELKEEVVNSRQALEAYTNETCCLVGYHLSSVLVHDIVRIVAAMLDVSPEIIQCNLYISPVGRGTPLHFDDHEVFVLQVLGSKTWMVAPNVEVKFPTQNYVAGESYGRELHGYFSGVTRDFMPTHVQTIGMNPGNLLFIPRGTWHSTTAEELSVSLSIGIFIPSALDIVIKQLRRSLVGDEVFRTPVASAEVADDWNTYGAQVAALARYVLEKKS